MVRMSSNASANGLPICVPRTTANFVHLSHQTRPVGDALAKPEAVEFVLVGGAREDAVRGVGAVVLVTQCWIDEWIRLGNGISIVDQLSSSTGGQKKKEQQNGSDFRPALV